MHHMAEVAGTPASSFFVVLRRTEADPLPARCRPGVARSEIPTAIATKDTPPHRFPPPPDEGEKGDGCRRPWDAGARRPAARAPATRHIGNTTRQGKASLPTVPSRGPPRIPAVLSTEPRIRRRKRTRRRVRPPAAGTP